MNNKLVKWSVINAVGVFVYTVLVSILLFNGEKIFGKMSTVLGPAAMLMLWVLSATIVGALVLGRPIMLYLDNQKKEALQLFGFEIIWLFILTILALVVQVLI